jgi:hypothetical protein
MLSHSINKYCTASAEVLGYFAEGDHPLNQILKFTSTQSAFIGKALKTLTVKSHKYVKLSFNDKPFQ